MTRSVAKRNAMPLVDLRVVHSGVPTAEERRAHEAWIDNNCTCDYMGGACAVCMDTPSVEEQLARLRRRYL